MKKQKWEYTITNGITGVIISFIMLTIFGSLALWFRISRNGAIIIGIILVIFASLAFFLALYRTLFFRVLIDKDGFFYQTTPGNGRYYHYYTILQIWVSSGNDANAQQMQYCNFETQDGRIMRFFFRNPDWDAVDYLIARVENTAGPCDQRQSTGRCQARRSCLYFGGGFACEHLSAHSGLVTHYLCTAYSAGSSSLFCVGES